MNEEKKIRDAADAIKGIVEAVPVYQDVVQPAAKEIGMALQTISKTLHILLAPVSGLVWGYDKIKDFVSNKVAEKLIHVPMEQLITPEPHIAGPALEALRYTGYKDNLREMYANLLATSIDSATSKNAHPAFVEIIKQIAPDEALIMNTISKHYGLAKIDIRSEDKKTRAGRWLVKYYSLLPDMAGCSNTDLGPSYLTNLQRLGLIELRETYRLNTENGVDPYEPLVNSPQVMLIKNQIENTEDQKFIIDYGAILLTSLGHQFASACIYDDTHSARDG